MQLGKQCLGCESPGASEDVHCWQCGLKHGERPAPPLPPMPEAEHLAAIRKKALDLGLLKETSV